MKVLGGDSVKIAGISKVRNEGHMIEDTLDHMGELCNAGLYVLDDCSTDKTDSILQSHSAVTKVVRNTQWDPDPRMRDVYEGTHRQTVYDLAVQHSKPDWVFCFDADEFPLFPVAKIEHGGAELLGDAIKLRLWDYYITPEDVDKTYSERTWIGPEYRDILMMFRPNPAIIFKTRVPTVPPEYQINTWGEVKHYGKAISVEEYEKTVKYYTKFRSQFYVDKWTSRKGKAVKKNMKSDFGRPLIKWDERHVQGVLLHD